MAARLQDQTQPLKSWEVLAVREPCQVHGCATYNINNGHQTLYNKCPACHRDSRRGVQRGRPRRDVISYRCDHDTSEGFTDDDILKYIWSAEADRKIDEFWQARGMTEDDARQKFGYHHNKKKEQ